jgi:hypothetical protein
MALQTKIRKSFMIAILSNEFSKKKIQFVLIADKKQMVEQMQF